ncbi:unnamed protein product [Prorocentrum cordatum]|uniref:Uncharacterized protein n=1 Tax=Prorocentrum cordatum TaxID=2364126 RepID=A0ABN9PC31_9DINO|nr:unnamed protein product [Polarella glacialis]
MAPARGSAPAAPSASRLTPGLWTTTTATTAAAATTVWRTGLGPWEGGRLRGGLGLRLRELGGQGEEAGADPQGMCPHAPQGRRSGDAPRRAPNRFITTCEARAHIRLDAAAPETSGAARS